MAVADRTGLLLDSFDLDQGEARDVELVDAHVVEAAVARRHRLRAEQRFEEADAIRIELAGLGIRVEDLAGGTRWSRTAATPSGPHRAGEVVTRPRVARPHPVSDIETMQRTTDPPVGRRWAPGRPAPLTAAVIALTRHKRTSASRDRAPGILVVAIGLLEAVAVRDGRFTPVLRRADPPRAINLQFMRTMHKQALENLCRRVGVEGRLCPADADRYRLEVHRLRAVHRIDDEDGGTG